MGDKERRIAELGCIVCRREGLGKTLAAVHHIRAGAGIGQKSERMVPLCCLHHRLGGYGVAFHAGPQEWQRKFGSETELADYVDRLLEGSDDTVTD